VNAKTLSIINYCAAALLALLSIFLGYKAYTSWRFYSNAESAVELYDSGQLGAAQDMVSNYTKPYSPGDPGTILFEAHVLSLQEHHERAVRILRESGLQEDDAIKLALATEAMYLPAESQEEISARIPLLEEAADACPAPEGAVSLCGAYLATGQQDKAATSLKAAEGEEAKLSLDGLAVFYVNAGTTLYRQKKYSDAVEMFKKALDLLPDRKLPPLSGERKGTRTRAEHGIAIACADWLTDTAADNASWRKAVDYVTGLLGERQFSPGGPKERWNIGNSRFVLLNALGIAQGRLGEYDAADKSLSAAYKAARNIEKDKRDRIRQLISLNRLIIAARKHDATQAGSASKYEYRKMGKEFAAAGSRKTLSKGMRYAAYNLSAKYYIRGGREKEARESLAAAIELAPDYPMAHVNLAVAYDLEGNKAEALRKYEEVLKLENVERRDEIAKRAAKLRE
jgi:tetratricopeptide (TPR) repeat protein